MSLFSCKLLVKSEKMEQKNRVATFLMGAPHSPKALQPVCCCSHGSSPLLTPFLHPPAPRFLCSNSTMAIQPFPSLSLAQSSSSSLIPAAPYKLFTLSSPQLSSKESGQREITPLYDPPHPLPLPSALTNTHKLNPPSTSTTPPAHSPLTPQDENTEQGWAATMGNSVRPRTSH